MIDTSKKKKNPKCLCLGGQTDTDIKGIIEKGKNGNQYCESPNLKFLYFCQEMGMTVNLVIYFRRGPKIKNIRVEN